MNSYERKNINLVIPMAGCGSRFKKCGFLEPKPLLLFHGKPFFWWAIESVCRHIFIKTLTFVVLDEHDIYWDIKSKILHYYPNADIVTLNKITAGTAETAYKGVCEKRFIGCIGFLDCDLVFDLHNFEELLSTVENNYDGLLCCFNSCDNAYSYAIIKNNYVINTVEKKVVSKLAIAGFYIFKNCDIFITYYKKYSDDCEYNELFMSGIYNKMIKDSLRIGYLLLDQHISLGTPEAYAQSEGRFPRWYSRE